MNKEVPICINCKHIMLVGKRAKSSNQYDCKASPYDYKGLPLINFVTGAPKEQEYFCCTVINRKGDCKLFEPGENKCNRTR